MNRPSRFGASLSTIAIAAVLSGCAANQGRESIFGSRVDHENIGLATRAQAELGRQYYAAAVDLAERAVENTPNDAGFRALLANAYFASGRFGSAESAYRDSLTLIPNQPQLILKLALVQIAQGKNTEALAVLDSARGALDAADYGLAVALAGQPDAAVAVLNDAARMQGADGRVRQNLALAYGLAGDWTMARVVASQDLPPEQLDSRIQQWMAMATPATASDQVAALTGVTPAADPGQPVRLALKGAPQIEAHAQLVVPQAQPAPQPVAEIPAQPVPQQVAEIPALPPIALAEPEPQAVAPAVAPEPAHSPAVVEAVETLIAPAADAAPVEAVVVPAVAKPELKPELPTRFDAPVQPASFIAISDEVRRAAKQKRRPASGRSKSVVQLGAYSSPERVSVAWETLTKRYPALAGYMPMRARFDGPKGTVWRLSIKGFASDGEARDRCEVLQSRGGKCFVRRIAGDSPVQLASR